MNYIELASHIKDSIAKTIKKGETSADRIYDMLVEQGTIDEEYDWYIYPEDETGAVTYNTEADNEVYDLVNNEIKLQLRRK